MARVDHPNSMGCSTTGSLGAIDFPGEEECSSWAFNPQIAESEIAANASDRGRNGRDVIILGELIAVMLQADRSKVKKSKTVYQGDLAIVLNLPEGYSTQNASGKAELALAQTRQRWEDPWDE